MKEKIEFTYPETPDKFQLKCYAGLINNDFIDICFPVIYRYGEIANGTSFVTSWGLDTSYEGEDKEELETVLAEASTVLANRFGITFTEKPETFDNEIIEPPHGSDI